MMHPTQYLIPTARLQDLQNSGTIMTANGAGLFAQANSGLPNIDILPQELIQYICQLKWEQTQLRLLSNSNSKIIKFETVESLLEKEILKACINHLRSEGLLDETPVLPEPQGKVEKLETKFFIKDHETYNFVGRLLGPKGITTKMLEQDTGCKIMIRGKGSMRNPEREQQNMGKAKWEHLNEPLHVLLQCEDYTNIAKVRIEQAKGNIKKLCIRPDDDRSDKLKTVQLAMFQLIGDPLAVQRHPNHVNLLGSPLSINQIPASNVHLGQFLMPNGVPGALPPPGPFVTQSDYDNFLINGQNASTPTPTLYHTSPPISAISNIGSETAGEDSGLLDESMQQKNQTPLRSMDVRPPLLTAGMYNSPTFVHPHQEQMPYIFSIGSTHVPQIQPQVQPSFVFQQPPGAGAMFYPLAPQGTPTGNPFVLQNNSNV